MKDELDFICVTTSRARDNRKFKNLTSLVAKELRLGSALEPST